MHPGFVFGTDFPSRYLYFLQVRDRLGTSVKRLGTLMELGCVPRRSLKALIYREQRGKKLFHPVSSSISEDFSHANIAHLVL
jgi:hypothetical protein